MFPFCLCQSVCTLNGTNFASGSTKVTVSGIGISVAPVNVMNSTSLTTVFVIAPSAPLGNRHVAVTTSEGTSADVTFTVIDPLFPAGK
jgi:hypothetical protein